MKSLFGLVLACYLVAIPVRAESPYFAGYGDSGTTFGVASEFSQMIALLSDDVLRDLMCRLSGSRFTPGNLSSALGMPEAQVLRRIRTLRSWGLVRMVRYDSATTIVEPIPGTGARKLRRWAEKYCGTSDSCGKPIANPLVERFREREKGNSEGEATSGGGGFEFKKKARRMKLKIGGDVLLVELYDTPTADAIFAGAPIRSRIRQSGGKIYFVAPIQAQEENEATYEVNIGDLVYSAAKKTISIAIEPSWYSHGDQLQFSHGNKISLATKSNVWGRSISDVRDFGAVAYGDEVSLEIVE